LKGLRCLEAVLALPGLAIAGDVHVEHAAIGAVDARRLLPAEILLRALNSGLRGFTLL
jgi:hypothetical protein